MRIANLKLINFRKFSFFEVSGFGPQLNVIVGNNAQGKTSLLESLNILTQLKSFRTSRYQDLISHGSVESSITADLEKPQTSRIIFGFDQTRKKLQIDGKPSSVRSRYPFMGTSVSFGPDDLGLIKSGPEGRRDFIDQLAVNIDPQLSQSFIQFEKNLSQRNRLLKQLRDGEGSLRVLEVWNESFIKEALSIYQIRSQAIQKLNSILPQIYNLLFGTREEINLRYLHQFEESLPSEKDFFERLEKRREAELAVGHSLIGPHRDDLDIQIGGLSSRAFASQGQCRSLVIALKVAQLELTKEAQKLAPILLLDDIISELDEERVKSLLGYLSQYTGQMFLTTVEKTKIENLRQNFSDFQTIELSSEAFQNGFKLQKKPLLEWSGDLRIS